MYKLAITLLAVCALAAAKPSGGKIVGGRDTDIREVPWQLSLQYAPAAIYVPQHICGASIVSANFALGAAHCLISKDPSNFSLRSGTSTKQNGGVVHDVVAIYEHPDWDDKTKDCDFVLFKVKQPFKTGDANEKVVSFPSKEAAGGQQAIVSGWGLLKENGTSPTQLQSVTLPMVSRTDCAKIYGPRITTNMICAGDVSGGHDSCQGDSGGPLVVYEGSKPVLAGVVSFGAGCARPKVVGVYSNVIAQMDWISKTMKL